MTAAAFPVVFIALYVGHQIGDHWVQTDYAARTKGLPGWAGRRACASHVASLTVTKLVCLLAAMAATGLRPPVWSLVAGMGLDAASHYWADRRTTLQRLAELIPGITGFYRLGSPRPGRDDNPSLGTGAYALDQSWHLGWLFIAALTVVGVVL